MTPPAMAPLFVDFLAEAGVGEGLVAVRPAAFSAFSVEGYTCPCISPWVSGYALHSSFCSWLFAWQSM